MKSPAPPSVDVAQEIERVGSTFLSQNAVGRLPYRQKRNPAQRISDLRLTSVSEKIRDVTLGVLSPLLRC